MAKTMYRLTVAGGRRINASVTPATLAPQIVDLLKRGYPCWVRASDNGDTLGIRLGDDGQVQAEHTTVSGGTRAVDHWETQILNSLRIQTTP